MDAFGVDAPQHESQKGSASPPSVDVDVGSHTGRCASRLFDSNPDVELVPWSGRLVETGLIDLGQDSPGRGGIFRAHLHQKSAELRRRLDDQRSRQDRMVREVIVEHLVREGHVLHAPGVLTDHELGDFVEEEVSQCWSFWLAGAQGLRPDIGQRARIRTVRSRQAPA